MKTIFAAAVALVVAAGAAHAEPGDGEQPKPHRARQLMREATLVVDVVSTSATCSYREGTDNMLEAYIETFEVLHRVKGKSGDEVIVKGTSGLVGWRGRLYLKQVGEQWELVDEDAAVPKGHPRLTPTMCLD